jgi:hypothetical protein
MRLAGFGYQASFVMSSQQQQWVVDVTFWIVLLVPPLVVLFWRLPQGTSRISWRRFGASIFCGWLLLNLHRWFIEIPVLGPILAARHFESGDGGYYDPSGGNVITFLFFWIPVLLVTAVYSLIALIWWRLHKKHDA